MILLTNLKASLNEWLETPKKNVKYLQLGKEQLQYKKYKHNWQLANAAILTLFWIIGLVKHIWGGYINLLVVLAIGYLLYALPYTYRQFNVRHHRI